MRGDPSTISPGTVSLLESLGTPKGLWHSKSMSQFEDETPQDETPLLLRPSRGSRRFSVDTARRTLSSHALGVLAEEADDIEMSESANIGCIIWPWNAYYRGWFYLTAAGAILTIFWAPWQIAFQEVHWTGTIDTLLNAVFTLDIVVNFNLVSFKDETSTHYCRREIATDYVTGMFWIDVVGAFPINSAVRSLTATRGWSSKDTLILSLLKLLHLVRLHRMKKIFEDLGNNAQVSLLASTLLRNFAAVMVTCHVQACCMYFLACFYDFDDNTWLGSFGGSSGGSYDIEQESLFERYVTSLYLALTTFTTVGYGDFSPSNAAEKIAIMFFMLLNLGVAAYLVGSFTLLVVKGDEKTCEYRDSLEILHQYGHMHSFEPPLLRKLDQQLRLEFRNREIADEQVLHNFPSQTRRKILRRLYKHHLVKTQLMKEVRPQFVDAFLIACKVEIFSPNTEICELGSVSSDLFLLVGGIAEASTAQTSGAGLLAEVEPLPFGANESQADATSQKLEAGNFIGAIGFFTESPQAESVTSLTVCKTLTMSRSTYKLLTQDHPESAGKILQNLLAVVQSSVMELHVPTAVRAAKRTSYYGSSNTEPGSTFRRCSRDSSRTAVAHLVAMHMRKNLDDQTNHFLFAASRGDTRVISLMCENGFDPNNADYDKRTALMVASMKGNLDVVELLLTQPGTRINETDMHDLSALLEAARNGHEAVMELLIQHGATLSMPEGQAAGILCQAVFQGDLPLLKRLVEAGIDVNAADYDRRTATHVAAAENNAVAVRLLTEHGANLALPDRWGNVVEAGGTAETNTESAGGARRRTAESGTESGGGARRGSSESGTGTDEGARKPRGLGRNSKFLKGLSSKTLCAPDAASGNDAWGSQSERVPRTRRPRKPRRQAVELPSIE